jgi:hypothetical protein
MMDVILRLLGVFAERAGQIVKLGFSFQGDVPLWVVSALAIVLGAMVVWMYRRTAEYVPPLRRNVMAALRTAFLLLLLLILIRPILAVTVAGSVRQTLLVLIDSSSSMRIADLRVDNADIQRAGIARGLLDPKGGLEQKSPPRGPDVTSSTRIDLVKAALKNDRLNLLRRLDADYDIAAYSFDRTVTDIASPRPQQATQTTSGRELAVSVMIVLTLLGVIIGAGMAAFYRPRSIGLIVGAASTAGFIVCIVLLILFDRQRELANRGTETVVYKTDWVERLTATGAQTAIGDGIRDAILRKRGQPLAGVLVVTDGGNNSGSLPLEAAKMAKAEGLPLYLYGVGITSPRDIIVGNVFAPDVTFVQDEVPVTVRVRSQGLKGQSAVLTLSLGGEKVDERKVDFEEDGEQVIPLKFTPGHTGDFDLVAHIDPRPDEVVKDNNTTIKHLRVVDGRIKVLLIDQLPRWDFKYLQALLLRERRVDAKFLLFEAAPEITDIPDSPYLKQFPQTLAELLKYDLVVLGDVDPHRFAPRQMENLNEFVSRYGGGLMVIAGKRNMPSAYRKTPIESMLPVEFDPTVSSVLSIGGTDRPIHFELTATGKAATMMKLSDKEQENLDKWGAFAPLYWEARVTRPKPAADVLLVDADPTKASRFGKMPIIAQQQYGLGNVLYIGTDNTWRWRRNQGEADHNRLLSQMVERMALPHTLGGAKRTQLNTDRQNYATGDRVTVYARLYREKDFDPLTEPTVRGYYAPKDGSTASTQGQRDVLLRAIPDQPGMYRGEFVAPSAGAYAFRVETDPASPLDFVVAEPTLEFGETALNEPLLRDIAKESGGAFLREEDLYKLPEFVKRTAQPTLSTFDVEFCYSPLYFMLLLGIVTAEWVLRKLAQLK